MILTTYFVWNTAMVAVAAYALWRGSRVEAFVGLVSVAAALLSAVIHHGATGHQTRWDVLAVDVGFFLILLVLVLKSDRIWLLFAAAFQLLQIVIHLAIMADGGVRSLAYVNGLGVFSYGVLLSITVGTWLNHREKRVREPPGRS